MAAELITPTDYHSGLPYPIIPMRLDGRPAPGSYMTKHHANHPAFEFRRDKLVTLDDYAARAWRVAQIQETDALLHNTGPLAYHNFYMKPKPPRGIDHMFAGAALSSVGYISRRGIDLSSGEPVTRLTTDAEWNHMRQPYALGLRYFSYGYNEFRAFFQRYAIDRGLGQVAAVYLHEFVDPKTPRERRETLGHFILMEASKVAVAPVRKPYLKALVAGHLHPEAPTAPQALVHYKMGNKAKRAQIFPLLHQQAELQLG